MAKPTVWVVDDDAGWTQIWKRVLKPVATVHVFESCLDAMQHDGRCDIIIVDISAAAPGVLMWDRAYAPICSFVDRHPGCEIIITSAMGKDCAEDVAADVGERVENIVHFLQHGGRDFDGAEFREMIEAMEGGVS